MRVLGTCFAVLLLAAAPAHAGTSRQEAFARAAAAHAVPESVLLGVSYLESRWDANAGQPSTGAGYGPMHLTDAPRGDDLRGDPARPLDSAALRTVDLASRLTGIDAATLRTDPVRNIDGGAAVLAEYQRRLGGAGADDPADWYGAVARYGGGRAFADEVYSVIRAGASRTTDDGELVTLPARSVRPETAPPRRDDGVECPRALDCEWIPAPYEQFTRPNGTTGYGNHDISNRPLSQDIDYIVIHDTEETYDNTLRLVQDPTYVSWQYTLRSADGHIAQHVRSKDVAWHAGNWYVNAKSIGLEHEGFAAQGTWYTEAMYRTSARLVRHLADRFDIPLDRQHILGHDNVQGPTSASVAGMHWDPGPYWDWSHYFELLGAPFRRTGARADGVVTIKPDFASNRPAFTGCETPGVACPLRGSSSVILRTEPRADAPLVNDIGLHPNGPSTMDVADIGSRVDAGQQFAVADRAGDWTAIWYLSQKAWFHNPRAAPTARPARGAVVTPRPGVASIPVYGRAYPEAEAYPPGIPAQPVVPLQYAMPAGQRYVVGLAAPAEYFKATTFDPSAHAVVRGQDRYYQVQLGHRVAYVKASDVVLTGSRRARPRDRGRSRRRGPASG